MASAAAPAVRRSLAAAASVAAAVTYSAINSKADQGVVVDGESSSSDEISRNRACIRSRDDGPESSSKEPLFRRMLPTTRPPLVAAAAPCRCDAAAVLGAGVPAPSSTTSVSISGTNETRREERILLTSESINMASAAAPAVRRSLAAAASVAAAVTYSAINSSKADQGVADGESSCSSVGVSRTRGCTHSRDDACTDGAESRREAQEGPPARALGASTTDASSFRGVLGGILPTTRPLVAAARCDAAAVLTAGPPSSTTSVSISVRDSRSGGGGGSGGVKTSSSSSTPASLASATAGGGGNGASVGTTPSGARNQLQRRRTISLLRSSSAGHTAQSLNSRYEVHPVPLGEGAYGEVFLATDRTTLEDLALKKISKDRTRPIEFNREMDALMYLRRHGGHPNICMLRENFDFPDHYVLILDLIRGGELFDHLIENGAYSEADAARLVREVASALDFCHAIGVVHGDLKPENLMLSSRRGTKAAIKIVDFGCSEIILPQFDDVDLMPNDDLGNENVTRLLREARGNAPRRMIPGVLGGSTPAYCPPESFDDEDEGVPINASIDMWSLGIIIYIMLTGVHPFDLDGDASDEQIEENIKTNAPESFDDEEEGVPINASIDMWSLGIIIYIMLTGVHPFDLDGDASDEQIEENIKTQRSPPLYDSPITSHLSPSALDLLSKLFDLNPETRLTAHEMLQHPWVLGRTASHDVIGGSAKRLSRFRKFETKVGRKVFEEFVNWSDDDARRDPAERSTGLFERAPPLYDSPITSHLSPSALDLLSKLFDLNPETRLTAHEMLQHPWVLGRTASHDVIGGSAKRLSRFRKFETKVGRKVFEEFVNWSDDDARRDPAERSTGLFERAFMTLDKSGHGVLRPQDLEDYEDDGDADAAGSSLETAAAGAASSEEAVDVAAEEEKLCLSGFSDLLGENMKQKFFPRGHVVYHEGDQGDRMYFINSGSVHVSTRDGFAAKLGHGDTFGEGGIMESHKKRSATIKCATPVHAIEIDGEMFRRYLAKSDSDLAYRIREKVNNRRFGRAEQLIGKQEGLKGVHLKQGGFVFEHGEETDAMYILEQGQVDVVAINGNKVCSMKPGDLFGFQGFMINRARKASASCVSREGCQLKRMEADDFHRLLQQYPNLKGTLRELGLRREFQRAVVVKTRRSFPTETELREVFDEIDAEKTGYLDSAGIKKLCSVLDKPLLDSEIEEMTRSLDLNDSGTISFDEFKSVFGGRRTKYNQ
eukprot:CAMPEP_0197464882 /NCGR_PEP_ID=MMETSP1175-20131217/64250_1 /TAXON_ID=1003142 /ORGANISM="Triceratium dubium, Strain CCMP147" /LENGTH=1232 /DNA_ID=CAMNT_0043000885 /DNA_START=112 /DNA_END=3811 /DNA_ORIENTATION=-